MRFNSKIFQLMSEDLIGESKSIGRVTVEPEWQLGITPPTYGGSVRGPFRWFQDKADTGEEWEVPNIQTIEWDRSESQDIATCTITLYNAWHEGNFQPSEMTSQLGKPGYFWPKRGLEANRWGQLEGRGAFRKDGFWDPNFKWSNVLIPYGLIRTYEGYGPGSTEDNFVSVQDDLNEGNVMITGTWLIESVSANSNGTMTLNCKDIGKLLLDQLCFTPTVPPTLYPLDYYPGGKSPFDSQFGAKPKTGVSPASQGEVLSKYANSSYASISGVSGRGSGPNAVDGNWDTYTFSNGFEHPVGADNTVWWEFDVNQHISKLSLKAWAGGYDCYVALRVGSSWLSGESIPGASVPAVTKTQIPLAAPDGMEPVVYVDLPPHLLTPQPNGTKSVFVNKVRIYMRNLYYSTEPVLSGDTGKYRAGIRDLIFYREGAKVSPYSTDFETLPWTYTMCSHPTRGYWIADSGGTVHGFGDAADYDSTGFGSPNLGAVHPRNHLIAMASHPSGKGYWCLDITGRVYAYGAKDESGQDIVKHYGQHIVPWPGTDKWGEDGLQAWDITPTYTGNGYWVIYGDGTIKGFGDATPNNVKLPVTQVGLFMNTVVNSRWLIQRNGNGICGHPTQMGFWATTGSGEVYAFGACKNYGQLDQRVYNRGMADNFRLTTTEFTRSIETTKSGNGYWIAFGSGHIAAFGDAIGQGPSYIYPYQNPGIQIPIDETDIVDWSFFRALVWDLARDPDGTGFWVLVADGSVGSYNSEFWGNPGWTGLTGYRWHEGNYKDYSDIMKDLLSWAGWTLYEDGAPQVEILGAIESTGIMSDTALLSDKFDKRPILDIIKELCEVVAYGFRIREDGGVEISSRNIWRSGNYDEDGIRIYVDSLDSTQRVPSTHPRAIEFIPLIDEAVDLFDYQTSLDSSPMRSEIIVGTDQPDAKFPTRTAFTRFVPRSATEEASPGIKMMRNIPRPAMWINQIFTNPEEQRIMAELIALNAWFAERVSSATCIGNPCLTIGSQVKFAERNTSEYNIHYITGIRSSHDLDSGEWTYTMQTHWLGDKDNWVITADNISAPVAGSHYIQISEPLDRWQQMTNRGLVKGGRANGGTSINVMSGQSQFESSVLPLGGDEPWRYLVWGEVDRRYNLLKIMVDESSDPLGLPIYVEVLQNGVVTSSVTVENLKVQYSIGAIGENGTRTEYEIRLSSTPKSVGNGLLRVVLVEGSEVKKSFEDTMLVVG